MLLFIKSPSGETILIDGGNNGKGKVVANYLKGLGFQTIDYMIATHPDAYNLFSKKVLTMPFRMIFNNTIFSVAVLFYKILALEN